MNPKNLEGKTLAEQKNLYEIDLIAEYEMEYGDPWNWSEDISREFDEKWLEIQRKFPVEAIIAERGEKK
jgi:hypothetical protein